MQLLACYCKAHQTGSRAGGDVNTEKSCSGSSGPGDITKGSQNSFDTQKIQLEETKMSSCIVARESCCGMKTPFIMSCGD